VSPPGERIGYGQGIPVAGAKKVRAGARDLVDDRFRGVVWPMP
jgi:hypothetical protein